jgi:hypothetical protein
MESFSQPPVLMEVYGDGEPLRPIDPLDRESLWSASTELLSKPRRELTELGCR